MIMWLQALMIMWMKMNKFKVSFFQLQPDTTDQTFGTATIDQDKNFKISPSMILWRGSFGINQS